MHRKILVPSLTLGMLVAAASYSPAEAGWRDRVYAMSDQRQNEIVVFDRNADGSLTHFADFRTGGRGFDIPNGLGAGKSLLVTKSGRWLFAANSKSNTITVMRASKSGLEVVQTIKSGGQAPASLTMAKGWLFVLNTGGSANITGFNFAEDRLEPLAGTTRDLNLNGDNPPFFLVSPAQVSFNPAGTLLAVTVKGDNSIRVYGMSQFGSPSANPVINVSNGNTPFGFAFAKRGRLLVAEAFGNFPVGTNAAGAVSSYRVGPNGALNVISGSVDNSQTGTGALAHDSKSGLTYTTNRDSGTVSGYKVDANSGQLELLDGAAAIPGLGPNDLAISRGGRFLYVTNAGNGTIGAFAIESDGSLTSLGEEEGLPEEAGAVGMATR